MLAIKAAVEGAEKLSAEQLEFAKDRIVMGTERKTMFCIRGLKKVYKFLNLEFKTLCDLSHLLLYLFSSLPTMRAGHAIVALNTGGAHPIHKATIMPRGSALGMVTQLHLQTMKHQ